MPRSKLRPAVSPRRALAPGLGAGAGALRRRRRKPAALLPELSVYSPASLDVDPSDPSGPPALPPRPAVEDESTSVQLLEESTSVQLLDESTSVELLEESTSLLVPIATAGEESGVSTHPGEEPSEPVTSIAVSVAEEPTIRPGSARPEATVDEETEMVARGDVLPPVLRLADLRLPDPVPVALPSIVLPGDWPMERQDSTPSQGVSAAVADDVQSGPPAEELDLLPEDISVDEEGDDLGDLLTPLDASGEEPADVSGLMEDVSSEVDDLADLLADAQLQELEHAERSVDVPGPARPMRGEPLPMVDSVDDDLPIELHDGAPVAGPEAWGADELPTQVEPTGRLAEALKLLQEAESTPLALGVVDGGAPPSPEDLEDDGLSLDMDTESVELLSLDVLLDATDEPSADPDVLADLGGAPGDAGLPEDDLSRLPPSAVWLALGDVGVPVESDGPRAFLELTDPAGRLELTPTSPAGPVVVTPPVAADEVELEEEALPPLDDRPPEEVASAGDDSVDELLILDDEDSGPASLTLEVAERDEAADLLAEGGAIRVDLGLGEGPAASPEEARKGVAVAPARPLRRWDGKSGENTERTTDLVALARLQENSGSAARSPVPPTPSPEEETDLDPLAEPGDDWLADVPAEEKQAPGVVLKKGDPMSPYYEDTMPGWLPGDDADSTRGAPRPADITAAGRGDGLKKEPSNKPSKKKRTKKKGS